MIQPERAQQVAELVKSALELPPDERSAFLDQACAGDADLRCEAESFLQFQPEASQFIEQGALHVAAQSSAHETEMPLLGHIEGYEIISRLGVGGMGEVYLAHDTKLCRKVALKLVRAGMDSEDLVSRFRLEERILASLNHPNIAQLFGAGIAVGDIPYFAMEYVEGIRIDEYCKANALSVRARLELFRKVCAAVHYAHQRLVIHRDLKSSNILVTADGEPKLLDFGIAKLIEGNDALTQMQTLATGVMTPDYASPEQVRGEAMTTSTDVYSLGVLLYELLTGRRPYRLKTRSVDEIARAITDQEPERPSTAVAKRDGNSKFEIRNSKFQKGDLDNIVLMALRKEPARRYASAGQFSEDIRRHLEGRPVMAHKDTVRYRAGKFVRRNRTAVVAALLVLLTVIGGIIATVRQAQIARQERDNAQLAQATTERLNEFLQSLLASANPDGMGRDVKVVQVLDAAAKELDRQLADQPEILAQAHFTIARAYARLRQAAPTEEHARRALEIEGKIHGHGHPATARVMAFLGFALRVFRRFDEAEPLLRQAIAVQRRHPPTEKKAFADTLVDLATVLGETGRAAEATPLVEEAIERLRKSFGEQSAEFADALNALGNLRLARGDVEAAKAAYRRAIDIHRQLTPPRFSAVNTLQNLIGVLIQQSELGEAEKLLHEVEWRCRATVGETNTSYDNIRGLFGYLHFLRGEYEAAIPELKRVVEGLGAVYPKGDPNVVAGEMLLGLALTRSGDPAAGERYLRAAYESGADGVSESFGSTENRDAALGECLLAQNRHAEAEPLLVESHKVTQAKFGANDPRTKQTRLRLVSLYDSWGKPEEAAPLREGR